MDNHKVFDAGVGADCTADFSARIGSSGTLAVSMTNEDLAIQIQLGHTELYGELWERCRKLLFKILRQKANSIKMPNYITQEDLEQEMYFALCRAVQAYDDTKPYSFNSYLSYSVMGALRDFLPDMRIVESSYNQTARGCDDGDETELIDFIEDKTAAKGFEQLELTDLQRQVRQAIAELPSREGEAVRLFFLKGLTYKQIAERYGVTAEMIRARKNKGINLLRRNKSIRALYWQFQDHYNCRESTAYYWV